MNLKPIAAAVAAVAIGATIITQTLPDPYTQFEPNPTLTPGEVDPALTQDVLAAPGFNTKQYRDVTESTKKAVFKEYGITDVRGAYEVDHLISLELGGSNDIKNLWPEPYTGKWNAHMKDALEDFLGRQVKERKMALADAQAVISKDWVRGYLKYVNPNSDGTK